MVKLSNKISRFSLDGNKENERDFVETEIIAEPGDEVGGITTIDGDRFINGKWYMTGNSTKDGEFEYIHYTCEFCGQKVKLKEPVWVQSECICRFHEYIEQRKEKPHPSQTCTCGATKLLKGGHIFIEPNKRGGIRCIPSCIKCYKLSKIQEKRKGNA
jgi:hypothetical protein